MVFMVEPLGEGGVLRIGGELKIDEAGELKSILSTLLEKASDLTVDVCQVTGVDLSCLQLFCAANRAFQALNRGMRFLGDEVPGVFKKALSEAGYTEGQCVTENYCKTCLWKGVREDD